MITFNEAKKMALREEKELVVADAFQYEDYYIFIMQPEGVDPMSEDALLDSYVIVNYMTGKIRYASLYEFEDLNEKAKRISL